MFNDVPTNILKGVLANIVKSDQISPDLKLQKAHAIIELTARRTAEISKK
jgi:hypothetical protein